MTCRCTQSTLRLFIRNVAQVDISRPATNLSIRRELCLSSGRSAIHRVFQCPQSRSNSTSTTSLSAEPQSKQSEPQSFRHIVVPDGADLQSAFADFSPASIDTLAAETMSTNEFEVLTTEIEPKSILQDHNYRNDRPGASKGVTQTPSNTVFRLVGSGQNLVGTDDMGEQESRSTIVRGTKFAHTDSSNIQIRRTKFLHSASPSAKPGLEIESNAITRRPNINPAGLDSVISRRSTVPLRAQKSFQKGILKEPEPESTQGDGWIPPKKEPWMIHKAAMREKFPEGWKPQKRVSPDAMVGIRALHQQMPDKYTTWVLADHFKVSPEAIRRILKSNWQPDAETQANREARWFRRGESVWSRYAELGLKPPRKWRDEGIGRGKPEWKKRMQTPPAMPALVTTAHRDGGYFGDDGQDIQTSEQPQLVTTARPPADYEHY